MRTTKTTGTMRTAGVSKVNKKIKNSIITKSEYSYLERVGNPFKNDIKDRREYFISISFEINDDEIKLPIKLDSGAVCTVIGTEHKNLTSFVRKIVMKNDPDGDAESATGNPMKLRSYVVNNFKLNEDIIFPAIEIFFSEQLGEKAILGMDILSLFHYTHALERGSSLGEFKLFNFERTKEILDTHSLNSDIDYVSPRLIASIDNINFNNSTVKPKKKQLIQDKAAAYIDRMIKEKNGSKNE